MEPQAFRFTGDAAQNYDQYLGPFLFEPYAKEIAARIDPNNSHSVLEIASGTGRVTRHIRQRLHPQSRLVATDISTDMLAVARARLAGEAIEFQKADALELPFPDETFEYVVCQFGIMFFPDRQKGFNEAFRVLKPGGSFIFNTWESTETIAYFKLLFHEILLPFFKDPDPSRFLLPFSLHRPAQLMAWMNHSGFANGVVERVEIKGQSLTALDLVNGNLVKHQLGQEVLKKDPEALPLLAARFEKEIVLRFGNNPVTCDLAAYVGAGIKPR
ncbi:MAG: methyltransferase domain-containing protein [Fibrobacterota bacterium]|nr:methyltransferase domain-containing protein [Fibrobacterota bacterium]